MFPYDEPVLETVEGIRSMQQFTDDDFIDLQSEFKKQKTLTTKKKKKKKK